MSESRPSSSPPTDRVVDVITFLCRNPHESFTVAEIGRAVGMSRGTSHALIGALVDRGWISRVPRSRRLTVGPGLIALGDQLLTPRRDVNAALRSVATAVESPVCVTRRHRGLITVTHIQSPPALMAPMSVGSRVALVAPFGREYVAFDEAADVDHWLRSVPADHPAARARLQCALAETRRRGYSIERFHTSTVQMHRATQSFSSADAPADAFDPTAPFDIIPGDLRRTESVMVAAVAAPILRGGTAVGGVTAFPLRAVTPAQIEYVGSQLRTAAQRLDALLAT